MAINRTSFYWLPYAVYLASAFLTFIVVEEDAFIYFRLAQNFADGYGLVFNRGGETIESGSGLTWQLMLAIIALTPLHLVIATKFLGVVFALLALWKLLQLSERYIEDKRFVIFPALLMAGSTPFYYWSHRGLETSLFVFALLWWLDVLSDKEKIRRWYFAAFFVFCSRPEGFLMVGALLPWLWLERQRIPEFWKGVGIFAAMCTVLFAWRLYYFHDLLPHAFYQKIGSNWREGFRDLLVYGAWNIIWPLVIFAVVLQLKGGHWRRDYVPLLVLLAVTAVWGVIGADWKSFNRQLSSWLPFVFLFCLSALGASAFTEKTGKAVLAVLFAYAFALFIASPYTGSGGQVRAAPNLVCLQQFIASPLAYAHHITSAVIDPEGYFTETEPTLAGDHIGFNRNATVGRFIHLNYPQGITVIFDQMGQAPWYAGLDKHFIDNTGLTDKQIGYYSFQQKAKDSRVFSAYQALLVRLKNAFWPNEKYDVTKKEIIERLFDENAELVLVRERYVESQPGTVLALMVADPRFDARYRKVFRINRRDVVYERRDLPTLTDPKVPPGALIETL